jgi:hypothetical protein
MMRKAVLAALVGVLIVFRAAGSFGAPKPDLWERWQAHDPQSAVRVDHRPWDRFLRAYVVTSHPSGVNRASYGAVTDKDREILGEYVREMESIAVSGLSRPEQEAYWINLYNALTMRVVLEHYPVKSIRDIDISPGFFAVGPWDAKLLSIEGEKVSLNDVEHRILRPIWRDNRHHYAVNCASIGCPNLQPEAFTPEKTERLLNEGASAYVNHPRGVLLEEKKLTVSSIYKWFQVDFGGSREGVIGHLLIYAGGPLRSELEAFEGRLRYDYDWSLNE